MEVTEKSQWGEDVLAKKQSAFFDEGGHVSCIGPLLEKGMVVSENMGGHGGVFEEKCMLHRWKWR